MLDLERLRECPFCGGKPFSIPTGLNADFKLAKQNERAEHYDVRCQSCSASAGIRSTPEKAIEDWNRRANDDEIERLRAEREAAIKDLLDFAGPCCGACKHAQHDKPLTSSDVCKKCMRQKNCDGFYIFPNWQWRGARNEEGVG